MVLVVGVCGFKIKYILLNEAMTLFALAVWKKATLFDKSKEAEAEAGSNEQ